MSEVERWSKRGEIAGLEYEGPGSLTDADVLRREMATYVEAAKRAGQFEVESMVAAREADRALGRMILAAREAGDLATGGERNDLLEQSEEVRTLNDLGISYNLASDAVALARVPDDVWRERLDDAADKKQATYRAVVRWAREFLDAIAGAEEARRRKKEEAEKARDDAEHELARLEQTQPMIPVPSLRPDETVMSGAGAALKAALPDPDPADRLDERPEVKRQQALMREMSELATKITDNNPVVRDDMMRDAYLYAARDSVRRLVDAATVWLRMVNAINERDVQDE